VKAILFALSFALAGSSVSAKTVFPPQGGPGDIRNAMVCDKGEYIVGFKGRLGLWFDRIGLICAPIFHPARMGPHHESKSEFGGSGGSPAKMACPSGLVRGISYMLTEDNRMVQGLEFTCTDPRTGALERQAYLSLKANGGSLGNQRGFIKNPCLEGEAATGLQVNWGRHVNAIGLMCEKIVLPGSR
jgi:hypothetical protein